MNTKGAMNTGVAVAIAIAIVVVIAGGVIYTEQHTAPSANDTVATTSDATAATSTPVVSGGDQNGPTEAAGGHTATQTVTSDDTGHTIYLHPGDRFLLNLGNELTWSDITVGDENIVSRVKNIAVINGAQGVYEAYDKGTTSLTAVGAPICKAGEACPQFRLQFKVVIVVN